ncbi:hypothetical protein PLICRDRAFT_174017 [Plicaturopsis crispa FD-325 SS-3]|nr:hypothetical protein PLICRDRAFT_174017 [Plicaturopsis crispa FD-325 SS-3]
MDDQEPGNLANEEHPSEDEQPQPVKKTKKKPNAAAQADAKPPSKASWSAADDRILVTALLKEKEAGSQADNSWKPVAWTNAAKALVGSEKTSGGKAKNADSCMFRFGALKRDFSTVKRLRSQSGWGWDDAHKKAAKWRTKPFPLYDDIATLVEGRQATGEAAFRAGGDNTAPKGSLSDDDEDESQHEFSDKENEGDNEAESTPAHKGRKRAASTSPKEKGSSKKRATAATAVQDMASAVKGLSEAFIRSAEQPGLTSPRRRQDAVAALQKDGDFSPRSVVRVIRMMRSDTGIADMYLSVREDSELRRLYIQEELDAA